MSGLFYEDAYRDDFPLMSLATGVVMPEEISEQLIDAQCLGAARMKLFVSKRINTNEVGFWEPMEKMNIKTFASLSKKAKVKSVDEKLVTASVDRYLFGRLLIASQSREINLRKVLKYELDPVPCALAHPDGSLRKTTKSVFLGILQEQVQGLPRLPVDVRMSTAYNTDGMTVVQMMKNAGSATFGELANKYFQVITAHLGNNGRNCVDVVFDHNENEELIKEAHHARRGSSSSFEMRISGPSTPVPKKWQNFISNPVNKSNLKAFLGTAWKEMAKTRLAATRN